MLSRVYCTFSAALSVSAREALHYAEMLNHLLVHSRVFVIQDLDGDRRYTLQMDTLIANPSGRQKLSKAEISNFLDKVTQDVAVLTTYFNNCIETAQALPSSGCGIEDEIKGIKGEIVSGHIVAGRAADEAADKVVSIERARRYTKAQA